MWQISMTPAAMLLIFGTYHEPGSLIPCANYKHSMVNEHPVRGHHNFTQSFP